jgi:hypothetical protein
MNNSPRTRFLAYVRGESGARPVVSPFLPHPGVVASTLRFLGLPVTEDDPVGNEIRLSHALDYEPMFMTDCAGLIFPWEVDESLSDGEWIVSTLPVAGETWVRRVSRSLGEWGDDEGFPVKTESDHGRLVQVCETIGKRESVIRAYFQEWRRRVGEDGVIVIGHPHVSRLGFQVSQANMIYHSRDYPEFYRASMGAIYTAALFVFRIAMEEGIDFMSESTYGVEMISPSMFWQQDLPCLERLSAWVHEHGGLFWYHNCGMTRAFIRAGGFNRLQPDVLETLAGIPEGDNDLAEARDCLSPAICTKGNLNLRTLRDGSIEEVERETRAIAEAVHGRRHILSSADAVLPGTQPENLVAFVRAARSV